MGRRMEEAMRLWLTMLATVVACGTRDEAPKEEPPAENLLMISLDTLRRDHVSRYDTQGRDLTPFLDSLMSEGVVADDFRSCSNWTFHATSCAFSGYPETVTGQLPSVEGGSVHRWSDEIAFLPDILGDAGFETTLASANGYLHVELGMTETFQHVVYHDRMQTQPLYEESVQVVSDAIAANPDRRWYYHLHLMEAHAPYDPPDAYRVGEDALEPMPFDAETDQNAHYDVVADLWPSMTPEEQELVTAHLLLRYDGELRWLDDQLRDLFADLDARGMLDDTLVVFWSDHGEQFWEHGNQAHAFQLFREENDGIFFTWRKGGSPRAVALPTNQLDVLPTTLKALGLDVPDGLPGLPLDEVRRDRPMFAATRGRVGVLQTVELDHKRLVYHWSGNAGFYDLVADPGMTRDLFDPADPGVLDLWELLQPVTRTLDEISAAATAEPVPGLPP